MSRQPVSATAGTWARPNDAGRRSVAGARRPLSADRSGSSVRPLACQRVHVWAWSTTPQPQPTTWNDDLDGGELDTYPLGSSWFRPTQRAVPAGRGQQNAKALGKSAIAEAVISVAGAVSAGQPVEPACTGKDGVDQRADAPPVGTGGASARELWVRQAAGDDLSLLVGESKSRSCPLGGHDCAASSEGLVRGAKRVAAEADVGGGEVAGGEVLDARAVRRDHRDAAVDEGRRDT